MVNDSLKQVDVSNRENSGKTDSINLAMFFANQKKMESVLNESNAVNRQIKELELVK